VKSKILISVADAREAAIIWHTKIFENVKKRDADGAQQAMIDHLKVAEKHLEIVVGVNDKINKKQK
jgi:DNA-binding FadR family transcriptional regulator